MEAGGGIEWISQWILGIWGRIHPWFLSPEMAAEASVVPAALVLSWVMARPLRRHLSFFLEKHGKPDTLTGRLLSTANRLASHITAIFLLLVIQIAMKKAGIDGRIINTAASLLGAWVVIRFMTSVVREPNWARFIAGFAWTVAALHILTLLTPTLDLLERLSIQVGPTRISILLVAKAAVILTLFVKLALTLSGIVEKRISELEGLTPSVQVLLSKGLRVTLLTLAALAALSSLGISLSAFAFIGGAVGVGVGFGLQKVVSNLVSGVILLMDKSIKPGDVIELEDSYGRIQSLGARYVSVVTRDGAEYLIPNEDLITRQVINWSFSNRLVRLKIPVGVSYGSDVPLAMRAMISSAMKTRRVLPNPAPFCLLTGFGDSSVDLEVRFWISDPENGIANVCSDVRLAIWERFAEEGIQIPFPQRDVHMIPLK